jgi:hypothetical protein
VIEPEVAPASTPADLRVSLTLPVISQDGTEWVICALTRDLVRLAGPRLRSEL